MILLLTLLLVKRDSNNAVTVLVPCELRGQQGLATFLAEFGDPQPVRAVTAADFRPKSKKHQEAVNAMWDYEREQFIAVLALLKALQSRDDLAITSARERVRRAMELKQRADEKSGAIPARDPEFEHCLISVFGLKPGQEQEALARWHGHRGGPKAERDERWLLSQLMSEALRSVQVVLWWSGREFRPALYCSEIKAALYLFLLMKVAGGQGWAVCPKCGDFFEQKRSNQDYCSIAHREAHRVARWRASQKLKLLRKRGKRGAHKER